MSNQFPEELIHWTYQTPPKWSAQPWIFLSDRILSTSTLPSFFSLSSQLYPIFRSMFPTLPSKPALCSQLCPLNVLYVPNFPFIPALSSQLSPLNMLYVPNFYAKHSLSSQLSQFTLYVPNFSSSLFLSSNFALKYALCSQLFLFFRSMFPTLPPKPALCC